MSIVFSTLSILGFAELVFDATNQCAMQESLLKRNVALKATTILHARLVKSSVFMQTQAPGSRYGCILCCSRRMTNPTRLLLFRCVGRCAVVGSQYVFPLDIIPTNWLILDASLVPINNNFQMVGLHVTQHAQQLSTLRQQISGSHLGRFAAFRF